jgi:ABC-type glutathione transport system ATPase component
MPIFGGADPIVKGLLHVKDLNVVFSPDGRSQAPALKGISFEVKPGEAVGILGESGSGKTTLALSVLSLLPKNSRASGSIRYIGRELLGLGERQLREIRGAAISIVFQEPGLSLHPTLRVGEQVADVICAHSGLSRRRCRQEAESALAQVRLEDVQRIYAAYPHQLSAGQRQRVAIAQALICRPSLLLADEPTAALDPPVQADILSLLGELNARLGTAIVLISHNPSVLAKLAHRLFVMHAGCVVEEGSIDQVFETPAHPYTRALLRPIPQSPGLGTPGKGPVGFGGRLAGALVLGLPPAKPDAVRPFPPQPRLAGGC